MQFLIVYATVEGHTRRIAEFIKERIEAKGVGTCLLAAGERVRDLHLGDYTGFIAASPVHQQTHAEDLIAFLKAHAAETGGVPSALVSVSLSAAFPDGRAEAEGYADRLVRATGWQPNAVHLAAGALRYDKYDFFQEQIIRHVVLKDRAPDVIDGDHDFTDWDALGAFVDDFTGKAGTGAV
jgi:menaquinone-dependent protoporphyrinogen oxidase